MAFVGASFWFFELEIPQFIGIASQSLIDSIISLESYI